MKTHLFTHIILTFRGCTFDIFSDILEKNDYSDTQLQKGVSGVVTFFILEVPDYKSAMLIYLYIYSIFKKRNHFVGRAILELSSQSCSR